MERLTEKRDGQNVIPLRQDGANKWALCSAGMGEAPAQYLHGDHADRLAAYEDTGYTPEDFDALCREMSDLRTALALPIYESLRDVIQGRRLVLLAVPPSMRPGCTSSFVYIIEDGEIIEDSVYEVILGEDISRQLAVVYSTHDGIDFRQECFGKTVFLTEDQAKAALEKGEKK